MTETSTTSPAPVRPALLKAPVWQHALGAALLIAFLIWWGISLTQGIPRLAGSRNTYLVDIAWPYLGLDFIHEYFGGATFAGGINPYVQMNGHPMYHQFTYPPIYLPLFSWCRLFPPQGIINTRIGETPVSQPYPFNAIVIWLGVLTAIFTFAACLVWRARQKLNYGALSLPLAIALILLSYPVVFAMERGSSDALLLLFILLGVLALRRKTLVWDIAAGLCIAIAAWMKLYPAFLIIALLGLRRWRAAICTVAGIAAIGLATFPWVQQWVNIVSSRLSTNRPSMFYSHSLSTMWGGLWDDTFLSFLNVIPGYAGAGILILVLAAAVTWFVFRSDRRDEFALPYILWMTALATFWPLISFDYNLFYLLLAAIIVWRRRDPFWIQMLMAYFILWWQPGLIWQSDNSALIAKTLGVIAIGMCLIRRIHDKPAPVHV